MSCKSWTYPETQALLDIWQQDHIQTQLTLMARNRPVWEQVAEIMKYRKGFNRTGEQCKTRIHTLKIRYNRAKKFGLSGPEAEKECPFYRQLDSVLGKNWIKKDLNKTPSPPSSASAIRSLYPLTFANDIDSMSHSGMIQILPKPIPKYMDTAFSKVPNGGLKVPTDKLEDMMGEHNNLIKKMLSSLNNKDHDDISLKETDSFEELIKSLVCSPLNGSTNMVPHIKTAFSPPTPSTPGDEFQEYHVTPAGDDDGHASKRRKLVNSDITNDKLVLLGSIAQIITNINELNKNIKFSQDQEEKKMKWLIEMQEKRLDLEKDHFRTMENLFSSLITLVTTGDQQPGSKLVETKQPAVIEQE